MNRFDLVARAAARPSVGRRYFTVSEANRSLVLVKRIVADVMRLYDRLLDLQEMIDASHDRGAYRQCEQFHDEIVGVAEKLQTCAEELDDVGVVLQDWSQGIVNFPHLMEGKEACLSWRCGDKRVEYWHEIDAAFAERQKVPAIPSGQPIGSIS